MTQLSKKLMSEECALELKKFGFQQQSEFYFVTLNGKTALIHRKFKAELINKFGFKKEEFTSCFTIDEIFYGLQHDKKLKAKLQEAIIHDPTAVLLKIAAHFSLSDLDLSQNKPTDYMEKFFSALNEVEEQVHIADPNITGVPPQENTNEKF